MIHNKYTVVLPTLWKSTRIHKLLQDLIQCDSIGEIIMIDNSSEFYDHYTQLEKVRVIQPKENLYVNPSWNLGVKEAKYNCIALINDDVNFDPIIFSIIDESKLKSTGVIGMDNKNYMFRKFKTDPEVLPYTNPRPWGWGCFILFHKLNYAPIPDSIKLWFGDDFLIYHNPADTYTLHNFPIKTEMSTTISSIASPHTEAIKELDGKIYRSL